jgi:hypothetical protein
MTRSIDERHIMALSQGQDGGCFDQAIAGNDDSAIVQGRTLLEDGFQELRGDGRTQRNTAGDESRGRIAAENNNEGAGPRVRQPQRGFGYRTAGLSRSSVLLGPDTKKTVQPQKDIPKLRLER